MATSSTEIYAMVNESNHSGYNEEAIDDAIRTSSPRIYIKRKLWYRIQVNRLQGEIYRPDRLIPLRLCNHQEY